MIKTKYILIALLGFMFFFSCKKYNEVEKISIKTGVVSGITPTKAFAQGTITNITDIKVTEHGHCWSSANDVPDFRINQGKTLLGAKNSDGPFSSNLTGLFPSTRYYVRSFFIAKSDTFYGNDIQVFRTLDSVGNFAPNVSTGADSALTQTSFYARGSIVNIGTTNVTSYGHCYSSTVALPTIANTTTNLGISNAALNFKSNLTGLTASTTYNVRAYATNSVGISYGNVVQVTTLTPNAVVPVVTTFDSLFFNSFNGDTAKVNGSLVSIGSSNVTELGHLFTSATTNPTLTVANTPKFLIAPINTPANYTTKTLQFFDVQTLTKYRFRAFATSNAGTGYGNEFYDITGFKGDLNLAFLDGSGLGIGSRILGVSAAYNGLFYFGMGTDANSGNSLDSNRYWVAYNPATNTFTAKTKCPFNIVGASSFVYNNKIYVVAGKLNNLLNTFSTIFTYDPIANTWAAATTFPVQSFWGAAGFLIGDKYYFGTGTGNSPIGGSTGSQFSLNTMYQYNLTTNAVTTLPNAPFTIRTGASAFSLSGLGYFVGGTNIQASGAVDDNKECWQFNPAGNVWTQKASFITSNANIPGVAFGRGDAYDNNGYLWAGKSFSTGVYYDDVCRYDPIKNRWKIVSKLVNPTSQQIYTYFAGVGNFVGKDLVGGCGDNAFNANQNLFILK
jgi:Kelch motif